MENLLSLQGKHVLLTGASSGMGRVFARMIASQGARVTLLARNEERLHQTLDTMDGDGHSIVVCDLKDEEMLNAAVSKMDAVDGIVLCAGINDFVPVKFIKQENLDHMFQTNYFSQLLLVQKMLKK